MITDVLITLGVMALKFANWVLSFFNLPYVSNMTDAISWGVNMIYMLNNTFPVVTLFACMTVLIICWFFKFQIKLAFETILPLIPFIGRRITLPNMNRLEGSYDNNSMPYYQSIRPNPSNKNGMGTFYLYKKTKKYK